MRGCSAAGGLREEDTEGPLAPEWKRRRQEHPF